MWRRRVEAVEGELHVLIVDLPGHGDSAATTWLSMQDTASAVVDVIADRAHGGTAHLVGLSPVQAFHVHSRAARDGWRDHHVRGGCVLENRTSGNHDGRVRPGSLLEQERVFLPSPLLDELELGGRIAIAPQEPALGFRAVHLHPHGRVQQRRQLTA